MVPGEGPHPARGVIVGEAPGHEEEKVGRPFVGPSGRLLDTALAALGVPRGEVYITNAVKEMPLDFVGKIRKPLQDEIDSWLDVLLQEIQSAAPYCVLTLGTTAFRALTDSQERVPWGVYGTYGGLPIVPAWHPAYVLRKGGGGAAWHHDSSYQEWIYQIEPWAERIA